LQAGAWLQPEGCAPFFFAIAFDSGGDLTYRSVSRGEYR
jgi:hypothetical protein